MTSSDLQVRRATIEDLPQLKVLWQEEELPVEALEKRLKEFQVAVDDQGSVRGVLGLCIENQQGCLHSEAFAHPEEADLLRDLLWKRLEIVIHNFGLYRVWTQLTTPFWHLNGFTGPGDELMAKLPAAFAGDPLPWLVIQLKEEPVHAAFSVDKEFALFRESEKQQTEKIYRQARVLKMVATLIAAGVLLFILISLGLHFLRTHSRNRGALPPPKPDLLAAHRPASIGVGTKDSTESSP